MTVSASQGPVVAFGSGSANESNPDRGPSLFDQGIALMDPRTPFAYAPGGNSPSVTGWMAGNRLQVINQVPSALATNNIAAAALAVSGTPITLVPASGAGITINTSITNAATGATVTGLRAIDGAMSPVRFGPGGDGTGGAVSIWDPTEGIARNVRITSAGGNDTSATFLASGYDLYGYPMSELITGANAGTASGVKAFKYVASVTPAGTIGSTTVAVGTGDVIGLPIRADFFGEIEVTWNAAKVTATTGFTAAVTTSPATTITGDVRGTYALQAASNGTLRLGVYVSPSVANISSATGLCGVTQA